ncbi:PTS system, beta-glucoside-specific IIABC component [Spiroplasma litorale]|uniref:PTS system, beta-glucoside-specific IIABC component n=1 Tax=Spiroplasma litorale TaxID=216942 RepID=A0A0K1W200_9MOLU|nr:glucose PTS transporter subunit IIA [Spiroplasma litorale]AKX34339.1 PTS system, beta-glucoside-specific IIABC component [Spiroplasma litorale]
MEIKLYAPCKCEVKLIENCSDDVFSSKVMGDGIFIKPLENNFFSPINDAKVELIFETKHAIFLSSNNLKLLMHIGIDTVKLNGEPFHYFVNQNDIVNNKSKLLSVDLDKIKSNNLSTETPILIVEDEKTKIISKELIKENAEKGDLIAIINVDIKEIKNTDNNNDTLLELKSYKSKYLIAAEDFVKDVGGLQNFSDVYNCMTRLRFNIVDKTKVDTKSISKNELVKGINWNGNELQIIIGGECYKVKDEVVKIKSGVVVKDVINKNLIKKPPISKRLLTMLSGIMAPNIPILMAVGLLAALQSLFVNLNITKEVTEDTVWSADMLSGVLFILSKVGLNLIGIVFCYTTCKYLKGNPVMAIVVGLTLTSRMFYGIMPNPNPDPTFGDWVGNGWLLFKLGNYDVLVKSYEGSVLPFIAAGVLCALSDKWIKTWMPTSIDIVFRPFLVYLFSIIPVFLVLGPALSFIEYGLSMVVKFIEDWPIGIGVAIFAFSWQILVLTGVHVAIVFTIMIPTIMANPAQPTLMLSAVYLGAFGQVGAGVGVLVITKNKQLKTVSLGALTAGMFGITEPMIYGVNLPKVRPFFCGCLGAGVAGFISGILKIEFIRPSGMGVFSVTGIDGFKEQALYVLTWFISIGSAAGFTILLYKEKNDEFKYSKHIFDKFNKKVLSVIYNKEQKQSLKKDFVEQESVILNKIKTNKSIFTEYFKYMSKLTKLEQALINLNNKEDKKSKKLYYNALKIIEKKDKLELSKVNASIKLFNEFSFEDVKKPLIEKVNQLKVEYKDAINNFEKLKKELLKESIDVMNSILKNINFDNLIIYNKGIFNAINATDISFGYVDQEYISFSKEEKNNFKMYKLNLK